MHSIKTKITAMTVSAIVIALIVATVLGMVAIRDIASHDADQTLLLLCETGQKDLNYYFQNVEQSVRTVAAYVETDLDSVDDASLQAHMGRASDVFQKLAYHTSGVLTYYYRIDPEVSRTIKGFWYVNSDDSGFREHEVTDITEYDTNDTTTLVWFTVPKATEKESGCRLILRKIWEPASFPIMCPCIMTGGLSVPSGLKSIIRRWRKL